MISRLRTLAASYNAMPAEPPVAAPAQAQDGPAPAGQAAPSIKAAPAPQPPAPAKPAPQAVPRGARLTDADVHLLMLAFLQN